MSRGFLDLIGILPSEYVVPRGRRLMFSMTCKTFYHAQPLFAATHSDASDDNQLELRLQLSETGFVGEQGRHMTCCAEHMSFVTHCDQFEQLREYVGCPICALLPFALRYHSVGLQLVVAGVGARAQRSVPFSHLFLR
jgi:hypothetical protein